METNDLKNLEHFKEIFILRLGWPSPASWSHFDYKKLSEHIKKKTEKQISTSTLKRTLGKWDFYEGGTSPFTKNTLAEFIDFKDWYDFCNFIASYDETIPLEKWYHQHAKSKWAKSDTSQKLIKTTYFKKPYIVAFVSFIFVVICSVYYFSFQKSTGKITGEFLEGTYPWSSMFKYSISLAFNDSAYIDFNDKYKEPLNKNNHQTHLFFYPDYYKVRLISNKGGTLDSTYAHIYSNGWCKSYAPNGFRNYPLFLIDITSPYSKPAWTLEEIDSLCSTRNKVDFVCKPWVGFRLFQKLNYSLDSFNLNLVLLNNEKIGGIKSNDAVITLKGEHNNIRVHLIQKGGFKWIDQEFSEIKLDGDKQSLTMFEHDLSVPTEVNIINNNQNVRVLVAGKEIYRTSYKQPIGNFKGITIDFRGNGHLMSAVMNGDTLR